MARRPTLPRTPISYSIDGAADAVGLSIGPIRAAISAGDLTPRFSGSKPLIGHEDLLEWFNHLPLDKPSGDKP